ncbi:MAG: methyltransferase domain-containing protein [bacterium]|nr:methyltransferase domain-containing protein [bacterium]
MLSTKKITLHGGTALVNVPEILKRIQVKDSSIVADLGCGGGGHFVGPLALMVGKFGKVYAVDIKKNVLQTVESNMKLQHFDNVVTVWTDLERYGAAKIPKESCDVVLVVNVLFQNKKHDEIIREALRLLKPGGKLVIIEWKTGSIPFGPPAEVRVSDEIVKGIASKIGLTLLDEFNASEYHYAIVFRKFS